MTDWIQRWRKGKIGWHSESINESLIKHIDCLGLSAGDTVFVPLCGKSKDMIHFMQEGFKVIGVEISELGVKQFFDENHINYSVKKLESFVLYYNNKISIYCGDFFDLRGDMLGSISGTYDRASLIALPDNLRQKYASHLFSIIPYSSSILLLTINYPQQQMSGPPFAVNDDEVQSLYGKSLDCHLIDCLDDSDIEPKFLQAGVDFFQTAAYCLRKNRKNYE